MNKRGQDLTIFETVEYILIVALGINLFLALNNLVDIEKYNSVRVEDIALTINSVYIPEGDLALNYDLGSNRNIIFEDGIVKTHIDDPLRERQGLILHNTNFVFEDLNIKTEELEISKNNGRVDVI